MQAKANRQETLGVGSPLRPLADRLAAFEKLEVLFRPVPSEWLKRSSRASSDNSSGEGLELLPCDSYRELITAWKKAVRWTDGLDHGLASMLASISSTKAVGDQLWLKVIGPASCGKSILCEALSTNSNHVLAKSTIRGFHSGFNATGDDKEDNSLIAQLYDKTLITKDGDTLLQSPNLSQILSEARDIYDSTSRTHYRNRMSKEYVGVRMTWLLCGTSSLRKIDSSELGERFLDCVIMDGIDTDLEDEILWRVVNRANKNVELETNEDLESHDEPAMANVKQMTGGYVEYLRASASEELPKIQFSSKSLRTCGNLGKFVAYMRARPSYLQEENAEREFAARLSSQLVRLGKCLAFVLNRKTVDSLVMKRVKRISLDTARGMTLTLAKHLYEEGDSQLGVLSLLISKTDQRTKSLLQFMRQIGITMTVQRKSKGVRTQTRWKLTPSVYKLFEEVMGEEE